MTTIRMLTAAAAFALIAGSAAAQTTPNTPASGQPADAPGTTPATDDTQTDANRQTPPTAPGDTATSTTGQSGTMTNQGSTNAGGTMGSTTGASPNAGGTMGAAMGASTNAGGAMGSASAGANVQVTAMQPIPDTPENRAKYGQPESASGKRTMGEGPVRQARRRR